MSGNVLINIRGAGGSGKTTAVKQYALRHNCVVKKIDVPFGKLDVSFLDNGIVIFGNYLKEASCTGADMYKNSMKDIMDCFVEIVNLYRPRIILYEHMLTSGSARGTIELSKLANLFGYSYYGVQLTLSEEKREKNMINRAGKIGKRFHNNNVSMATELLKQNGIIVDVVDVEHHDLNEMWRIVDDAVRKAVE